MLIELVTKAGLHSFVQTEVTCVFRLNMSLIVTVLGVLLLLCGGPSNAEMAPLYMFTTAIDARETVGITGIKNTRHSLERRYELVL